MNKFFTIIILTIMSSNIFGQIGINTTNVKDGLVLEVNSSNKGVMFPTVALTARNNQAPLVGVVPTGTLIFNTVEFGSFPYEINKGFYWWDNEHSIWMPMATSLENVTCQYKNQESTINFHLGPLGTYRDMDLFANLVFSENFDIYQKVDANSLKINKDGLYAFTINLEMFKPTDTDPEGLSTRITVNGVSRGTVQYWRSQENEGELSHHFTEYLQLNEGDVIKIQTARSTTSSSTRVIHQAGANTSDITIQRIR